MGEREETHQEEVGAGGEQEFVSPHLAVITGQSDVRQALRLVEGGEDEAHVGEVRGPLEVVGLHGDDCLGVTGVTGVLLVLSHVCSPSPSVDCKGWPG